MASCRLGTSDKPLKPTPLAFNLGRLSSTVMREASANIAVVGETKRATPICVLGASSMLMPKFKSSYPLRLRSGLRFGAALLDSSHFEAHGEHDRVTHLELEAGGSASLDASMTAHSAVWSF